jgi:hypothetical protein
VTFRGTALNPSCDAPGCHARAENRGNDGLDYCGKHRPARRRTPSGHDIPVPESVFQAIHSVGQSVQALTTEVRTTAAANEQRFAKVEEIAKAAAAMSIERWTNLLKALVPLAVVIVGGVTGMVKLTEAKPPMTPPPTESALSADLVECQAKPEAEQKYCVANAFETDKLRRSGARP